MQGKEPEEPRLAVGPAQDPRATPDNHGLPLSIDDGNESWRRRRRGVANPGVRRRRRPIDGANGVYVMASNGLHYLASIGTGPAVRACPDRGGERGGGGRKRVEDPNGHQMLY